MAWDNFTQSWFGLIFNPVGYMAQHKNVEQASHDYADTTPPAAGLDEKTTEAGFIEYRSAWIDQCAGTLKTRDVGYTLANATRNCSARFDEDPDVQAAKAQIEEQAAAEKKRIEDDTQKARTQTFYLLAAFLIAGLLLYLFLS